MSDTAQDILELEKKLNDCEGDDVLNKHAIEIFDKLVENMIDAEARQDSVYVQEVQNNIGEFSRVLDEIDEHRHKHALDEFVEHVKNRMQE